MNPAWSKIALFIWLGLGVGLLISELVGLHRDNDGWPTLTEITVAAIKAKWWIGIFVFGFLFWLIIHFGRRVLLKQKTEEAERAVQNAYQERA